MPLTKSGRKVMKSMKEQYGKDAESIFYATMNKMKKAGKRLKTRVWISYKHIPTNKKRFTNVNLLFVKNESAIWQKKHVCRMGYVRMVRAISCS